MLKWLVLTIGLLAATEARAQTRYTAAQCTALEVVTNIGAGFLTLPLAATNLGMGLGAALGSKRGVGIGAVVTGSIGIFGSALALYFIYPVTAVGCNPTATIMLGATGVAMGGFALGMGIWRIIASSRPSLQAWNPWMAPVIDERSREASGFMGGFALTL